MSKCWYFSNAFCLSSSFGFWWVEWNFFASCLLNVYVCFGSLYYVIFFFKEVNYLSKNYYYFPSLSHIYDFSFVSSLCHLFIFFKLKKKKFNMGNNLYCQYLVYVHEGLIFFPWWKSKFITTKRAQYRSKNQKQQKLQTGRASTTNTNISK